MTDILLESTTPLLAIDGPRATIRLNRPKHLNRLQQDDLEALMALFAQCEILLLLLTGLVTHASPPLGAHAFVVFVRDH